PVFLLARAMAGSPPAAYPRRAPASTKIPNPAPGSPGRPAREGGRFKESDDLTRSLRQDRKKKAKRAPVPGQGRQWRPEKNKGPPAATGSAPRRRRRRDIPP